MNCLRRFPYSPCHWPGTLSALDQSPITTSRAVGAIAVYSRLVDGRALAFEPVPAGFRSVDAFWFAWAAFHPATSIHGVQP